MTTFVLDILLYLAFLKLFQVAGVGWLAGGGWMENLILMKTQSSVWTWTWTWTLDFDLGFVNLTTFNFNSCIVLCMATKPKLLLHLKYR